MKGSRPGRHLLGGTLRGIAAESLFPITALITAAFLTRRLGPEGYGLLVLAATLVAWVEWSINSFFSRATIKFVGETENWQPLANELVRLQLIASVAAMVLIWLLAIPLAHLLNEPQLGPFIALMAVNIPMFNFAHAHKNILLGMGNFAQSANLSAARWIARLVLIVVLVEAGLSVQGAILGTIGASLVELIVARRYVRPSLFGVRHRRPLWRYGLPLFFSALSLSLYARVDLFALKLLGGTTQEAGLYGAAQNLSLLPAVFATAFIPALLSTLSRLLTRSELDAATEIGRNAMRAVVALMPLAAIVAGSAGEIITVFFGQNFEPAAILFAALIFGSFAVIMIQVAATIFTAAGLPARTLVLTGPLVPLAIAGHLLFIPLYGSLGAAGVTAVVALIGASWAVWSVNQLWGIVPPLGTLIRGILVSVVAFAVVTFWPTPGLLVLLKLFVMSIFSAALYFALAEFSAEELALARSFFGRRAAGRGGLRM